MTEEKDVDKLYEAIQKLTRAVLLCTGAIIAKRYSDEELSSWKNREPFYFGDIDDEEGVANCIEKYAREQHINLNNWEFLSEE